MSIQQEPSDYNDLKRAVLLLESPSIIARISNIIGVPLEGAVKALPASVSKKISGAVEAALHKAANAALWSLDNDPYKVASTKLHKFYAATSGALGGAFGFTALLIELPVSTTIMMRSVADVARSEGFNLSDFSTKYACIEVFAMGSYTKKDDATETGYYIFRGFMTESMRQLSKELAEIAAEAAAKQIPQAFIKITPAQTSKWFAEIIAKVAARFNIVITEKFAAQTVPVVGAVTGAIINTLFTDFYQDMARGHFIVKRLEAKYSYEQVRDEYKKILGGAKNA
jgi:5-carboxymethyl-2-hydroxymuconate isomerase